jgi:hypothetical protein
MTDTRVLGRGRGRERMKEIERGREGYVKSKRYKVR